MNKAKIYEVVSVFDAMLAKCVDVGRARARASHHGALTGVQSVGVRT